MYLTDPFASLSLSLSLSVSSARAICVSRLIKKCLEERRGKDQAGFHKLAVERKQLLACDVDSGVFAEL